MLNEKEVAIFLDFAGGFYINNRIIAFKVVTKDGERISFIQECFEWLQDHLSISYNYYINKQNGHCFYISNKKSLTTLIHFMRRFCRFYKKHLDEVYSRSITSRVKKKKPKSGGK